MRKPLVTYILFAFNQEDFIRDAVKSALAQTYSPLEIIISDDCSNDRTFEVIADECSSYRGDHRVILNRNDKNLGVIGHVNTITARANGQYIVAAAGDDLSVHERTAILVEAMMDCNASSVGSNAIYIDRTGHPLRLHTPGIRKQCLNLYGLAELVGVDFDRIVAPGATLAYRRDIFTVFGSLPDDVMNEDWMIPFRAALLTGALYLDEPLVKYRIHDRNLTYDARLTAASYDAWRKIRIEQIGNWMRNYDNLLTTLRTYEHKLNLDPGNVEKLSMRYRHRRTCYYLEREMLGSESRGARLYMFLSGFRSMRFDLLFIKSAVLAVSRRLYFYIIRWKTLVKVPKE